MTKSSDKIKKIFNFLEISEELKNTKRWLGVKQMKRKETSADHSWSLAVFCLVMMTEFKFNINLLKSLKIALTHDLVEAIAGDVASLLVIKGLRSSKVKNRKEISAMEKIGETLPLTSGKEIECLWYEYEKAETKEAKFAKAMDKLESQTHMINSGSKSFHDPDVMGLYAHKVVENYPELKPLYTIIQNRKESGFQEIGWHWKKIYDTGYKLNLDEEKRLAKILDFMTIAFKLKKTKRYLNTKEMKKKESSAEHSWNVALLSFIVAEELDLKVDVLKSMKIALVHDLVEALAGDTDYSLIAWGIKTKEEKHKAEKEAIEKIRDILPEKSGTEIYNLWHEYEDAITDEARYIKALDKIEGINHMLCLGSECFDHPELIAPYPNKAVKNYPPLFGMLKELHNRLKPKFKEKCWPWLREYADYLAKRKTNE